MRIRLIDDPVDKSHPAVIRILYDLADRIELFFICGAAPEFLCGIHDLYICLRAVFGFGQMFEKSVDHQAECLALRSMFCIFNC